MIIKEICDYIHNYFVDEVVEKTFTINDGSLDVSSLNLLDGQYYMIEGSILNDGMYQHPCTTLKDEVFKGAVIKQRIPTDVLELSKEISAWNEQNSSALLNPMQSESFGGYSYSKGTSTSAKGGSITWRDIFGKRLESYRKIG